MVEYSKVIYQSDALEGMVRIDGEEKSKEETMEYLLNHDESNLIRSSRVEISKSNKDYMFENKLNDDGKTIVSYGSIYNYPEEIQRKVINNEKTEFENVIAVTGQPLEKIDGENRTHIFFIVKE